MKRLAMPIDHSDHIQGEKDAPFTLLEYGDYECTACGLAYPIVKRIQKHFGSQLRFVFRHFPLTKVHPHAEIAAETVEFAGKLTRFWEMHELLFENQKHLEIACLIELAEKLQLPTEELKDVLITREFEFKIHKDILSGVDSHVKTTPTFFINEKMYEGRIDFDSLVNALDKAMA